MAETCADDEYVNSPENYLSVSELYDQFEDYLAQNVAMLDVTFDETCGIPTEIAVDIDAEMADDEYTQYLSNLRCDPYEHRPTLEDIDAAEAKFEQCCPGSYSYRSKLTAFNTPCRQAKLQIRVRNDKVRRVEYVNRRERWQCLSGRYPEWPRPQDHKTMTEIFDSIRDAVNEDAETIDVWFNEECGYPRKIVYDLSSLIMDEGHTLKLWRLQCPNLDDDDEDEDE
jgi:hypothetical protein